MHITFMGMLLIPFGLILLLRKIKYLAYVTLFFSFFTGASVLNVEAISYSLTPSYLFGLILIIKYILNIFDEKLSAIRFPSIKLSGFVLFSGLSLIMPMLIGNNVIKVLTPDDSYEYIKFSLSNITQYSYLVFCFIICVIFINLIHKEYISEEGVIKTICISAVTWGILGIYQLIAFVLKLPYDEFFRASMHGNIQPFGMFIRVYSVAIEPSMFAMNIIFVLSIMLLYEKEVKFRGFIIILMFIVGVLTTSTTFMIGTSILLLILAYKNKYMLIKIRKVMNFRLIDLIKIVLSILVLIVTVKYILSIYPNIIDMFSAGADKIKGEGVSGSVRKDTFLYHLVVAQEYPIMGVGYGGARTKDLLSTLLVNVGFVGIGLFLLYLFDMFIKLVKMKSNFAIVITVTIFICFLLEFVSVPEPYMLFLWIFIACGESLLLKKGELK